MNREKYLFSNGKTHINVKTVADAIRELSLLPPDLPMDQYFDGHGSDIAVMNIDTEPFVEISEGGFWDKDVEFFDDDEDEDVC